jgi:hypothetical protein
VSASTLKLNRFSQLGAPCACAACICNHQMQYLTESRRSQ